MKKRYAIVVHGGAGDEIEPKTPEEQAPYLDGLRAALEAGEAVLEQGGSALDAVEAAVLALEDNPLFNAGKGAAFVSDGTHRLDASVMRGEDQGCGVIGDAQCVRNPVLGARAVMEKSPLVMIAGEDADLFARENGLETVQNNYFSTNQRYEMWLKSVRVREIGGAETVGAVALDEAGNLAAATSTGGLKNARPGRISDSAVIGAGTWASNETVAVSCSGTGEQLIRYGVAHEVHSLVKYDGCTVQQAAERLVHHVLQKGDGGLIAVDHEGNVAMPFNTPQMWRGVADSDGRCEAMLD